MTMLAKYKTNLKIYIEITRYLLEKEHKFTTMDFGLLSFST